MFNVGSPVNWRSAQRCETGACVEVARVNESFAVRDSKNPSGPILTFSAGAWSEFVAGVHAGDFEHGRAPTDFSEGTNGATVGTACAEPTSARS